MCGIAGFVGSRVDESEARALLQRMNRALRHRGPDDEGVHLGPGFGLAHRRLSVIDLDGGHQPMVSQDGKTAIVLNGEIYNYRELRDELTREGFSFRTTSDTEVVLRLYERYGKEAVHRLRGMFALAVWDERMRSLWLARDRIGIKPLYYYQGPDLFLFGSELKAILAHPDVPRRVDEQALDDFLTLGYIPAPRSILLGVRKLRAGHMVTFGGHHLTDERYWDLDFTPHDDCTPTEAAAEVGKALRDSVRSHLVADVPLGVLLSGGVDSSAILAFMSGELGSGIPCFTAGFRDAFDEDPAYARKAATAARGVFHDVSVTAPTTELLDRLAWHYDEPFSDPSAIPTYAVCELARREVPVCLSGDGGDENFGGYRRHRRNQRAEAIRRLVPERMLEGVFGPLASRAPEGRWVPKPLRLRPLLRDVVDGPVGIYHAEVARLNRRLKKELYAPAFAKTSDGADVSLAVATHLEASKQWDSTSRLLYVDFKTYLADCILTKVDRASMAHGLEVRVPLLDHRFVECVARIRPSRKVGSGRGKEILKRALAGSVPRPILRRRKRGFTPPLECWFDGDLGTAFQQRVLNGTSFVGEYLRLDRVRERWETRGANYNLLWAILALENWARTFL